MSGANTLHFDDGNFEAEVLNATQPVLVDFWAEWCGPCQFLGPTIDELADAYTGRVKIGKVDIDKAIRTASRYDVQSIPTVIVFEGGQPVERFLGIKKKADYMAVLDARVAAK